MRWLIAALLLGASALATAPATTATAEIRCPDGFQPHMLGEGDHEHGGHQHVGLSMERVDLNDNGFICVKHVDPAGDVHIHIDDLAPRAR
jgi:hypothetical protein